MQVNKRHILTLSKRLYFLYYIRYRPKCTGQTMRFAGKMDKSHAKTLPQVFLLSKKNCGNRKIKLDFNKMMWYDVIS